MYVPTPINASPACDIIWNRPGAAPFSSRQKEDTLDWNRVEGNWKQVKGAVKQQWES
jgi:hypothetical protein